MSRRRLLGLALVATGLLLGARLAVPQAPPVYDGISVAPEPYRYVSPPPDLASTNRPAAAGQGQLQIEGGANKLATVQTDDKQVLAFFPQGVLRAATPTVTIKITPEASPPPPPAGNTPVGNVYRIEADGFATPPPLGKPLQVLVRVPPQKLSSVQVFYDGAWHDTQWGTQTDYVNLSMDRLGLVGAFDDGRRSQPPPKRAGQFNPVAAVSTGLVAVAILIVVAGIVVQRRRNPKR